MASGTRNKVIEKNIRKKLLARPQLGPGNIQSIKQGLVNLTRPPNPKPFLHNNQNLALNLIQKWHSRAKIREHPILLANLNGRLQHDSQGRVSGIGGSREEGV